MSQVGHSPRCMTWRQELCGRRDLTHGVHDLLGYGKGAKDRHVPLHREAVAWLDASARGTPPPLLQRAMIAGLVGETDSSEFRSRGRAIGIWSRRRLVM
jgi:integrase